ncbi:hypothetical protein GGQ84_003075 [Desulfitispora alkaliphila]
MKRKQKFSKAALRKAKDVKHAYSETYVEPMDPCARPDDIKKDKRGR